MPGISRINYPIAAVRGFFIITDIAALFPVRTLVYHSQTTILGFRIIGGECATTVGAFGTIHTIGNPDKCYNKDQYYRDKAVLEKRLCHQIYFQSLFNKFYLY
jgi:hypothetical protein